MQQHIETWDGVVVPAPATVQSRPNRYGSIPDLPDEELADPEELEYQVFLQEWGPVLSLPVRKGSPIRLNIDEYFGVDWGAFATVDFERTMLPFDKARYKADKLREQRRDVRIRISTMRYGIRGKNKYVVLRYALRGVIDTADILDRDLRRLAELYLRERRLTQEIERLCEARRRRKQRELAAMLARWE